jgi:hypothetical protein
MRMFLAFAALIVAAPLGATPNDLRSIAGMQSHNRVLLVFAPRLGDPRMNAQRTAFARIGLQASERDLVLVQVDGARVIGSTDRADRLRRKFDVPADRFRALLIGKDGRIAHASPAPIAASEIVARIDAMPMRRAEVRRAQAGLATSGNSD